MIIIILFLIFHSTNAFYIKPINRGIANEMVYSFIKKETALSNKNNLLNDKLLYDLTQCLISTSDRNRMNEFVDEEYYTLCTPNNEDIGLCIQERISDTIYYRHIVINPEIYNKIHKYHSKIIFIFLDVLNDKNKEFEINMESLPKHIKLDYLFHLD